MAFTKKRTIEKFAKEHDDIDSGKQRAKYLGNHVESHAMEKSR
jgi:hypothetical protein